MSLQTSQQDHEMTLTETSFGNLEGCLENPDAVSKNFSGRTRLSFLPTYFVVFAFAATGPCPVERKQRLSLPRSDPIKQIPKVSGRKPRHNICFSLSESCLRTAVVHLFQIVVP